MIRVFVVVQEQDSLLLVIKRKHVSNARERAVAEDNVAGKFAENMKCYFNWKGARPNSMGVGTGILAWKMQNAFYLCHRCNFCT